MANYKFITDNNTNDNKSSNTQMPAKNRKRHKPVRGIPKTDL